MSDPTTLTPPASAADRVPLDVHVRVGVAPMARFVQALLKFKGTLTAGYALDPRVEYTVRIHLAPDNIEAFAAEAKVVELRPAPRVGGLFMDSPAPPRRCQTCGKPEHDHPYRHPFVAWQPGNGKTGAR